MELHVVSTIRPAGTCRIFYVICQPLIFGIPLCSRCLMNLNNPKPPFFYPPIFLNDRQRIVKHTYWRVCHIWVYFLLAALAKLRKATKSFVISICPSVRMKQLGSNWADCHQILYFNIFRNSVEKIQFSSQSDKNNGYLI